MAETTEDKPAEQKPAAKKAPARKRVKNENPAPVVESESKRVKAPVRPESAVQIKKRIKAEARLRALPKGDGAQ